ncbi:MAG: autotransporter domain-containing protein [Akkermansia sp.]|nr:autotransporter domain-containing protein [Akkermansia sp.]
MKFENVNGTEIGSGVKFNTTKAGSDINITTNGTAWINRIAGTVGSAGAVSVFGSTNQVLEQSGKASIYAADGISITATKENSAQNAELKSQNGPLTLTVQVSGGDEGYNTIYSSSLVVEGEGNVEISGGDAYLRSASVTALQDDVSISGGHVFVGQSLSDTSASTLDAAGKIDVAGATVRIQDSTSIDSVDGNVSITASGSDTAAASSTTPALSVTGGNVSSRSGDVKIAAENGTAALADVEVNGDNTSITGDNVVVSGKTVTGAQSVEIAGTESTTISNVDVSGSGTASLGTSTGATAISDSGVAVDGQVDIKGSSVSITRNEEIDAGKGGVTVAAAAGDASITGGSVKGDGSVAVSAMGKAKLTDTLVEGKDITTSGKTGTELQDTTVDGSEVVTVASDATTQVQESIIRGANTTVSGADTSITLSEVSADETVTITGTTTARVINSELSGDAVNLNGGALTLQDAASVKADAGDITVDSASLTIGTPGGTSPADSMTAKKNVAITVTDGSTIQGAAQVVAETGAVTLNGGTTATNLISGTGTSVKAEGTDGMVDMDGKSNTIAAAATVTAAAGVEMDASVSNRIEGGVKLTATSGNVTMTAATQNTVADSTVTADNGSIAMGGAAGSTETVQNEVTAADGTSPTLTAEQDVTITGENSITGSASGDVDILTRNGDISIHGHNEIQHAGITAAGGVAISTGTGDKATRVEDADISGMTVTIAGDTADDRSEANLAVVTGSETNISSRGGDDGAGITLNNVSVVDTVKGTDNIKAANGGHIAILNRVDVFNGSLTIQSSDSYDSGAGRIVVDGSNVLNMKADSSLEGRLSGAGSINKSGGDALLLDRDHRDFSGTIYANGAEGGPEGSVADADNAGSWIQVTDAGVGEGAMMVLNNTDLVIETSETQIGSLDTTQDAGANKASTGGTLGADASYTADGNTRADFKTIGSVVEVNKGVSGDVVHAANLALSDATLLKLDATVDAEGNATSDIIAATGTVDVAARTGLNSTSTAAAPSTARVYVNHTDRAAASQVAEGTRTTIMSGTMAGDINEDVLYDVEKSANGTYQRTLQDRNVHLENKGDRVDLVFSKNYRSAAKTASMQKVAEAIRQYSDAFHHSEGWLASSDDRMAKLVDAFDYTRSEAAAQRGLQSLAGMGNVLPQLMLFDASRHHLNQLRKQMEMPVCPRSWKGAPARKSNAWLTYTGAHDSLNGDANMGDYTRSAHGAMMGVDTALTCKLRAGLSLGYETASGEADSAKVDADSIFVDAYATAYTRNIKHRASVGLALTSFDSRRGVEVEAGYHSFHGTARSDTDALTLNFGYEISSDYKLSERSWLTRFASLNLAWHNLDDMKESSLGEIGLVSEYDSEWQAGVAVGLAFNREFAAVKYEAPAVFSAHAAVHFELLADKATATNRFSGADGGWEVESMDREQLYFELGVGVMVPLSPAWTASAGAAVEVGADRSAFSGNVGVRYAF